MCLWAVVGLGNPGSYYSQTRHNVGFIFIKRVTRSWNVKLRKKSCLSKTAVVERDKKRILLAMPQTYMNKSGLAVKQILERREWNPVHLIAVYDDLDIPLGEIRVRKEGGPGSHKGMISIIQEIETTRFPRIRIGIGPLKPGVEATDYVLSPFSGKQKTTLEKSLAKAQEALELIIDGKIDEAMNEFNVRPKSFQNN